MAAAAGPEAAQPARRTNARVGRKRNIYLSRNTTY
jgi:hypothetical protein